MICLVFIQCVNNIFDYKIEVVHYKQIKVKVFLDKFMINIFYFKMFELLFLLLDCFFITNQIFYMS